MRHVEYRGLSFGLPKGDEIFHKKIFKFVDEIPFAVERLKTKPTGTLVVIGACFGATVIAGLKLAGMSKCVAFEPDPRNRVLLKTNLTANGVEDRVTVIPAAAWAGDGVIRLQSSEVRNIGGSRIMPDADLEVPAVSVDKVLADLAVTDVGLVWCDAQGSEPHIFRGATGLLTGSVPWGVELAPGLITGSPADYCRPLLTAFDTVVDLRTGTQHPARDLPTLYAHYKDTPSPNHPDESWHTQLLLYRG